MNRCAFMVWCSRLPLLNQGLRGPGVIGPSLLHALVREGECAAHWSALRALGIHPKRGAPSLVSLLAEPGVLARASRLAVRPGGFVRPVSASTSSGGPSVR